MSTIGGLLMPQFKPYDLGGTLEQANRIAGGVTNNQTALLTLADLKAKQQAEQEMLLAIQQNPALAQQLLGGGSVLGSLGPAGAPPGAPPGAVPAPPPGAITQSPLGGGPAQQIPAYPDASRYAGVPPTGGGPIPPDVMAQTMPQVFQSLPGGGMGQPQSTIASLGPQPQGSPQPPQNPLLEMARRDPRAALMLQQQMQQSQDRQWKMQEQQLDWSVKTSEYVARMIGSVKNQGDLDQVREQIRQVHPQAAAQMPQFYSKEAIEALQQKGIAVANLAAWQKDMATARRTDLMTQRLPDTMQRMSDFITGGTPQAPPGEVPPTRAAPQADQQTSAAPPEYDSAITEANRLYPQVPVTRIKSIIAAESNFDAKAVSNAGTKGPMQLMDATAKDMGVDDPFNVRQNVMGGTRYYAQMLTKYGGDERKALTAYNWGPQNLDKVGGDVTRAPAETQAYVQRVLGGGGSVGPGTAQAPPTDPRIAGLEARIKKGQALVLEVANQPGMEAQAALLNQQVNDLQKERDRLEERSTEVPRAVEKEKALQPLKLEQQRAGAEVQLEAKMNEPIGTDNAIKMDLPPQTKWKDVPKDTKVLDRPGEGMATKFGEYKASYDGITRVIGMLDKPGAASIIGTLFSDTDAAFRRRAGEWVSSVTPQERKFAAAMVAEIASIRHNLAGSAVSPEEAAFVKDMMPTTNDPDVGTVRAKLEVLQEWVATKHEGLRSQAEEMKTRTPKALAKPVAQMSLDEARAERERIRKGGG